MADTRTEHLNLIKQDPEAVPDYLDDHSNLEILDEEVWKRGKAFNGQPVGEDGGFHIRNVPYAENLETSASQNSDDSYIIRTSGGEASINDGDAWLTLLKGDRTHTGYVAQDIQMTVIPMARTPDPDITATLDEETFEAYVVDAGTYTISYDGTAWSTSPTLYGLTISNTPIAGDSITMEWDGEEDAIVTVNAATRPTPDDISATIDEDTFVSYVSQSGTTTLTYSTAWSADPALYGITVTGTPIAGDVITVMYVKEVRGTITQSTPETFVSTGWNLYNHALGYARLIKYHEEYGFKVSGTYTALEFATSITGTRTTITPVSGYFTIPSDGYLFVTGGNNTSTQVWMTWSDWGTSANGGVFAKYSQTVIDISTFMAENFPYGLLRAGSIRDEINLNVGISTSYVVRQAYNATNLANAKASGREYEYDENYIYLERETPVTYSISVDGDYTASDHGLEYFTGTDQAVYAETIYGANLKNKLERDVLTISQQTLTSGEKSQVKQNIGMEFIDTATVVSNLDNIPLNAQGRIKIAAAVSPTGSQVDADFYCFGTDSYRLLLVAITSTNTLYYNSRHNSSTWKGWQLLASNLGGWRTYANAEDFGGAITSSSTLVDIFNAMDSNSMLQMSPGYGGFGNTSTLGAKCNGVIVIFKWSSSRHFGFNMYGTATNSSSHEGWYFRVYQSGNAGYDTILWSNMDFAKFTNTVTVTDCDDATEQNVVYMCKDGASNSPDSAVWWHIRPLYKNGDNLIIQIATQMNVQNVRTCLRQRSNSGWSSWRTIIDEIRLFEYIPVEGVKMKKLNTGGDYNTIRLTCSEAVRGVISMYGVNGIGTAFYGTIAWDNNMTTISAKGDPSITTSIVTINATNKTVDINIGKGCLVSCSAVLTSGTGEWSLVNAT